MLLNIILHTKEPDQAEKIFPGNFEISFINLNRHLLDSSRPGSPAFRLFQQAGGQTSRHKKLKIYIKDMSNTGTQDQRIAKITFTSVYPMYLAKVEKKGRTKEELHAVISWLTGYSEDKLQEMIHENVTFEAFFQHASLHPNSRLITGVICGYRVENIENPLTQQVRYLDKLVDELAKGRKLEKILRG